MIKKQDELLQNLIDAGCSEEMIAKFMCYYNSCNKQGQLCVLNCQRKKLLEQLHEKKQEIDCLDYLIYQYKREDE